MTGSFDLDKPILLTAVVAFGFSRRFGLNIYDSGTRSVSLVSPWSSPSPALRQTKLGRTISNPEDLFHIRGSIVETFVIVMIGECLGNLWRPQVSSPRWHSRIGTGLYSRWRGRRYSVTLAAVIVRGHFFFGSSIRIVVQKCRYSRVQSSATQRAQTVRISSWPTVGVSYLSDIR